MESSSSNLTLFPYSSYANFFLSIVRSLRPLLKRRKKRLSGGLKRDSNHFVAALSLKTTLS
jgi:hypothetical protein